MKGLLVGSERDGASATVAGRSGRYPREARKAISLPGSARTTVKTWLGLSRACCRYSTISLGVRPSSDGADASGELDCRLLLHILHSERIAEVDDCA